MSLMSCVDLMGDLRLAESCPPMEFSIIGCQPLLILGHRYATRIQESRFSLQLMAVSSMVSHQSRNLVKSSNIVSEAGIASSRDSSYLGQENILEAARKTDIYPLIYQA